jgi:hydroxyethylthiazole kinase-like uncharacterized protein yjeF
MQRLFDEVNTLDEACYEKYHLTPDLLMEHAALSVATYIRDHFSLQSKVLIITGSGHNGADGLAVARLLNRDYDVNVFEYKEQKSELGQAQKQRAVSTGVSFLETICCDADIIVDALFGSGLNRVLDEISAELMDEVNMLKAFKIAVDVPSGILSDGRCSSAAFAADVTISMGALTTSLYSDAAKDLTGEIRVADLGVSRSLYETTSPMYVLDVEDMRLPLREHSNTHKGSFGHANFICGNKSGAAIMAGLSALNFGAGLVTLISHEPRTIPFELMQSKEIVRNCTVLCLGMGLGAYDDRLHDSVMKFQMPLVIDADLFYDEKIRALLAKEVILTPHPKEFSSLLKITGLADIDVATLQENRLKYVKLFMASFPQVVLLLKGANVIIASQNNIYINPHGSAVLSKGGSGDVLSGLITALLAQDYSPIEAAITASLAHATAGNRVEKSSYAVTPKDLINQVAFLE